MFRKLAFLMDAADDKKGAGGAEDRGDDTAVLDDDPVADPKAGDDAAAEAKAAEEAAAKAAEEAEAAKAAGKEPQIPKGRFDAAVKKEREAAAAEKKRADELQTQLDANKVEVDLEKIEGEIADLEEALDKALADNDPAEKRRIRAEIRAKTDTIATAKAEARSRFATAVAVEQIRYDALVDKLEAAHPALNPDHDDYDESLTGDMLELKAAYEATGMSSTEALTKASRFVLKEAPKVAAAAKADDKGEKKEPTEAEKKAAAEVEAKRVEDAVKKGLDAKGKQPASGKQVGAAADAAGKKATAADVAKMTDKDFDALPEDEKKRLRGDAG